MHACAVPAEANVMVTCRRLSNDEPEVVEINRDDTDTSAVVITPPATKGLLERTTLFVLFQLFTSVLEVGRYAPVWHIPALPWPPGKHAASSLRQLQNNVQVYLMHI